MEWCKGKIASYKKPRVVRFVPELPLSPVGKVLRSSARDRMIDILKKGM